MSTDHETIVRDIARKQGERMKESMQRDIAMLQSFIPADKLCMLPVMVALDAVAAAAMVAVQVKKADADAAALFDLCVDSIAEGAKLGKADLFALLAQEQGARP